MKKLLLAVSAFALLLGSCSKSDSPAPADPPTQSNLVSKIVSTSGANSITTNFNYNGNKIINEVSSDGSSTVFTYNGDLITKVEELEGTAINEKIEYSYYPDNKLKSILLTTFNTTGNSVSKYDYVYSTATTIAITFSTINQTVATVASTGKAFLTNDQITKVETYYLATATSPASTHVSNYTYDTKINPFYNITGFKNISLERYEPSAAGSSNNGLTGISTIGSFKTYEFIISNTYNAANYPITGTVMNKYYSNTGVLTSTTSENNQIFY